MPLVIMQINSGDQTIALYYLRASKK